MRATVALNRLNNDIKVTCIFSYVPFIVITMLTKAGDLNPLNVKPRKWSNILKQFVGNSWQIVFGVFDHFARFAIKRLNIHDPFSYP